MHIQKRLMRFSLALAMLATSSLSFSQDTADDRKAAAIRHLKVVPMAAMLDDMVREIGKTLPENQRERFTSDMKTLLKVEDLERIAQDAMAKTFSAEELNALTEFHLSKNGASVMKKMGLYMAEIMPEIQSHVMGALKQMEKK